jgi:serine/threonine protein kinase
MPRRQVREDRSGRVRAFAGRVSTFGAYRVLGKLGEGGMGAVFLAEHSLIGRRAAIKVLRAERNVQRDNVERFFNEARATSAVVDPGIVQVFDFGVTEDNTAYIVMEYLEGEVLVQRLRRLHRLAPLDALRIVRQVAGSLAAASSIAISSPRTCSSCATAKRPLASASRSSTSASRSSPTTTTRACTRDPAP